ncbi:MAG: PEP-CTERM sorting domain-containing protein [Alphaproteobacteria bacterium]|nr:PEP-CTERM sorting domain-containing protein [Alphaproteobacteria bacterium]
MRSFKFVLGACAAAAAIASTDASASLTAFQSYNGNYALSTDGWGGLDGMGVISASVPAGSTVVAAYLYTATQNFSGVPTTVTLDGNAVTYTASFPNATACCTLSSHRADVTSIVQAAVGGGGGVFDFNINEGGDNSAIDGSALVVVYSNPSLPEATVGLLDGFASVTGDTTSINFADPLDPTQAGFFAQMVIGDNFSCCNQRSTINVNGQLLTENAGNFDDGEDLANGSLITVGSFDDPFSPTNPSYDDDHEKYDLTPFITLGDTSITVDTINASQDDNIFFAGFYVSGIAGINEPPPPPVNEVPVPAAIWLFGAGIAGLGARLRKKKA